MALNLKSPLKDVGYVIGEVVLKIKPKKDVARQNVMARDFFEIGTAFNLGTQFNVGSFAKRLRL